MSLLGAIPARARTAAHIAFCTAMVFGALGLRALAQDTAATAAAALPSGDGAERTGEPRDLPIPAEALPERARGPSPTDSQVALMAEMDAVTDATSSRNELEQAERVAPIDLYYGLPEAR